MCESPAYLLKTRTKKPIERKSLGNDSRENSLKRDPFATLSKSNSNKLEPLSPIGKLPKLNLALPPRPPLGSKKSLESLSLKLSPKDILYQENEDNKFMNTHEKIKKNIKLKRIKITGSNSAAAQRDLVVAGKKRNSVVVLDAMNDITFGMVGNIITKNNID